MEIRNHTQEDYPLFCEWWKQWGWPVMPYEYLPPNSLVIMGAGVPICAVFLYRTDSPILWAENYISDKLSPMRNKALQILIDSIPIRAAELGYSVIMSAVKHDGLARRLKAKGFVPADDGLTNYVLKV